MGAWEACDFWLAEWEARVLALIYGFSTRQFEVQLHPNKFSHSACG